MSKSHIIQFIRDHPTDWRIQLLRRGIDTKDEGRYTIFKYGVGCDFSDPLVQEARGIIIDTVDMRVACWPFRKFGNYQESYCDPIDWSTARVQEKIDGSIVKLWYDPTTTWRWSTMSMISSLDATTPTGTFSRLIRSADNYRAIDLPDLNKEWTYIFELVSPETQVVIEYPRTHLYHIGTRSNVTGEEMDVDIGIEKPKEYPLKSIDDCIKAAEALNQNSQVITNEGFVVVDKDWHRIKIKSPRYLAFHRMSMNRNISKEHMLSLILDSPESVEEISKAFPQLERYLKYYDWQISEFKHNVRMMMNKARAMYEEFSHERKAVAAEIKNDQLASFGFKALGNDISAEDIISKLTTQQIAKHIKEYA